MARSINHNALPGGQIPPGYPDRICGACTHPFSFSQLWRRQKGAVPDFQLSKVAEGVWAAIVSDEGLAGGNAGFVIGDDSVLVADTFHDPRPASALLAEVRKLTRLPIGFVVNAHYHFRSCERQRNRAAAGAASVAHPGVRA